MKTLWKWTLTAALAFAPALQAAELETKPREMRDGGWIRIHGVVSGMPQPNAFDLDYGYGKITVEMDDWSPEPDGYKLVAGDEVEVTGRIDQTLLDRTTVEAAKVYVENYEKTYYANAKDEEEPFQEMTQSTEVASTVLQGTITKMTEGHFTIETGDLTIQVDATNLSQDFDQAKLEVGDVVHVAGMMERSFFADREFKATRVLRIESAAEA